MMHPRPLAFVLFLCGLFAQAAQAQETCMLEPIALSRRASEASLVVEARVIRQQAVSNAAGRIFTINQLEVFKVFKGQVPADGIGVAELGGTLGDRRQEVSGTAGLAVGEQGVFFLEPDPASPDRGAYRLFAGPQGLVRYDALDRSAADPFGRYRSIEGELYPAVERITGQRRRELKANTQLSTMDAVSATAAAPVISSFSPASLASGVGAVLTINGSGFGATQGSGRVEFPNADAGGSSYIAANATDYVQWSDTRIQLRIPSRAGAGGAGSGTFRVIADGNLTATSPTALSIIYAYSTIGTPPVQARLVNDDTQGGYTMQYSPNFAGNAPAKAAFERALASWTAATRMNWRIGTNTTINVAAGEGTNVVRFDVGAELPAGVLGQTTSYYSGCSSAGVTYWSVGEMDFVYNDGTNWNFGPTAPTSAQYDFESVALHEAGHAHQLGHIIRPGAVMHYAIANGQSSRRLSTESDIAGGLNVIDFSLNSTNPCRFLLLSLLDAVVPLPVELVSFTARYEPELPGTRLRWATANELNSSYFAVQASDDAANAAAWREIARVAAAGQTTTRRNYDATDARPVPAGQVRYYRLRQVDNDGTEHFSATVTVTGLASATDLQVFPNPAVDVLQVRGPLGEQATNVRITLVDAAGRLVRELRVAAASGAAEVPVADLRNGVYILQWQAEGGPALRRRVLVQH